MLKKGIILGLAFCLSFSMVKAQETPIFTNAEGSEYKFEIINSLERDEVGNQGRTGTCWSFSSLSFF